MTTPFTYCITNKINGKRYYGFRSANGCHPSDIGTSYFSSSEQVLNDILKEGKDNFKYVVRKTFNSSKSAAEWEHKVLRRLKASASPLWYNRTNGGSGWYTSLKDAVIESNKRRTKETFSEKEKENRSRAARGSNNPAFGRKWKGKYHHSAEINSIMGKKNSKAIIYFGVEYPSLGEATKIIPNIKQLLKSNSPEVKYAAGVKPKPTQTAWNAKPVSVDGVIYRSQDYASEILKIDVRSRVKSPDYPTYFLV